MGERRGKIQHIRHFHHPAFNLLAARTALEALKPPARITTCVSSSFHPKTQPTATKQANNFLGNGFVMSRRIGGGGRGGESISLAVDDTARDDAKF